MRVPQSNVTMEGTEDAIAWLNQNTRKLGQLRYGLVKYYQKSGRDLPWRRSSRPYEILIAEILLQKTGVRTAKDVWNKFIHTYPSVEELSKADIRDIEQLIRPLGIHKRANLLLQIAQELMSKTGGEVVDDQEFLMSLPRVGKYTSAAVLSFGYNQPVATIDVNAARVYTRIGGFLPNTLRQGLAFAEVVAAKVITQKNHREINYGVLDLAAQICTINPKCKQCLLLKVCQFGQANLNSDN
jgi:A/G-specific adenine glycosylase